MHRTLRVVGLLVPALIVFAACVPPVSPPDAPPLPANCAPRGANGTSVVCGFVYTGGVQSFTTPAGIRSFTIDAWGAQGAGPVVVTPDGTVAGGLGGHARGTLALPAGTLLVVRAGGQDGFNGGGAGANKGGGASDVRLGTDTLAGRVVVAGGGGGAGRYRAFSAGLDVDLPLAGGAGGGVTGGPGQCDIPEGNGQTFHVDGCGGGAGATAGGDPGPSAGYCLDTPVIVDATAGAAGAGGAAGTATCGGDAPATATGAGGGGGWFGGGGGGATVRFALPHLTIVGAGGGGSGYVTPDATDPLDESGVHEGNGAVTIAYSRLAVSGASCHNGGWRNLVNAGGHGFTDESACVAFTQTRTPQ